MNKGLQITDKINLRLKALEEYVKILKSLQGLKASEIEENVDNRAKAERYLQLAAETCLDIAELVISNQRLRIPETSRDTIEILGDAGILDKDFAYEFAKIAGLRNILVHDYLEIDYGVIVQIINHRLEDFNHFAQKIAQFYSKT